MFRSVPIDKKISLTTPNVDVKFHDGYMDRFKILRTNQFCVVSGSLLNEVVKIGLIIGI
ncbi:hypothetical protein [Candidatus Hodgkinia cicadicola]|uniref:hypothetical protein n=1 Tax=Candidatus Hodgkinia cicadicola TaxID=573658 RepID=UPI002414F102